MRSTVHLIPEGGGDSSFFIIQNIKWKHFEEDSFLNENGRCNDISSKTKIYGDGTYGDASS
jgi:hypothetical protein